MFFVAVVAIMAVPDAIVEADHELVIELQHEWALDA